MESSLRRARFLFDLNGYFIVRNALSPEEVSAANRAIDAHQFHERKGTLRNAKDNTAFSGDMKTGRFDMGGMLGWESPHRDVFRSFLAHPKLIPYLHLFIGEGYRLDHSPLIIAQEKGSEGFSLHGGSLDYEGQFIPQLQYVCRAGTLYSSLLAVSFQLTDHNEGDGGFCVVPGSHKINFPASPEIMEGKDEEFLQECVQQPVTKAGDVVIFSEATIHGCMPWNASFQRRIALYRFSPAHLAFARGYCSDQWPERFLEGMTPEQLAVMLPPFHPMYDRPKVLPDGSLYDKPSRAEFKISFDEQVFGQKYY